jgi:hypothetical protein
MTISRDEAFRIASEYVQAERARTPAHFSERIGQTHLTSIREVLSSNEVGRPPLVYGLRVPIDECWIAYLHSVPTGIRSSQVVIVSKDSGQVLYFGSASDEG